MPTELMIIELMRIAMIGVVVMALGIPVIRLVTRLIERRGPEPASLRGMDQRLERIEHAVDAMALEVERISEGQRFTTRLLAERVSPAMPPDRLRTERGDER